MDDVTLAYLDDVRQRIIAVMASATIRTQGYDEVAVAAQQAMGQVLPALPGMIEARVPGADARIYTPEELRKLLAEFAADMLAMQTDKLVESWSQTGIRGRKVDHLFVDDA